MIPPALGNGEPNSTMANQIVYSPKETILEGYFCTQMVPSSCETKWFSIILCICFRSLRSLSTANALSERSIIPISACLIALMKQCKPKIKRVKPRLEPILVTSLAKPNCSWASLPKVDYQYFVHILFTTQSMIRYCRIYMYIFPRLYLPSMSKLLF